MFGTPLVRRSLEVSEMDIISRYSYLCRWILYPGIHIYADEYYIQIFILCRWILYISTNIQMDIISGYSFFCRSTLYSGIHIYVDLFYIQVLIFCSQMSCRYMSCIQLYINLACLAVCLIVCLYPINVKWLNRSGPNFL